VGGGVKAADIPALAKTGVDGFFVVSAVCGADDPHAAAQELVTSWKASL
jgi:thiamine monophosphate synthase